METSKSREAQWLLKQIRDNELELAAIKNTKNIKRVSIESNSLRSAVLTYNVQNSNAIFFLLYNLKENELNHYLKELSGL